MIESRIGLGTVQWGLKYGIANSSKMPKNKKINQILDFARTNEIKLIDTAHSYGTAEHRLGLHNLNDFHIITKTKIFKENIITSEHKKILISEFEKSLLKLKKDKIYAILIHDIDAVFRPGGKHFLAALQEIKSEGLVEKIGISIYDSKYLNHILDEINLDIVQLPFNIINQNLLVDGTIEYLISRGIEIHARSIFLQGLLLMEISSLHSYFNPWIPTMKSFSNACLEQGFSKLEACINFVLNIREINKLIVGVESLKQIQEIVKFSKNKRVFKFENLNCSDDQLINPSNWGIL